MDYIRSEKSNALDDLQRLLSFASSDPEARIRYKVVRLLTKTPPFKRG